jgi:hypothetical protein
MNRKTCTRCFQDKDISEFRKMAKSKDGHQYQCKECMRPKLEKYYQEHAGKIKQNVYKWRHQMKNP